MTPLVIPPLFIPSPAINGFMLGPVKIHFYALCILVGIVVAWWLSAKRWRARGGKPEQLEFVLMWAIPFGIVGARIYHVLTHLDDYFGPGRNPVTALYIWEGGIGIIGAISFGALGAWIACRRLGLSIARVADVLAPGIIIAQGIGRLGNYFNQELFGIPTTLPWGLEIDLAHRPPGFEQFATFHPTFLYEMLWNFAIGLLLLWLDRRFKLGFGKLFFLYVALYTVGRLGTESLRIDPAELLFGIRNHQFLTGALLVLALVVLAYLFRARPGKEPDMEFGDDTKSGAEEGDDAESVSEDGDESDESHSEGGSMAEDDDLEAAEAGEKEEPEPDEKSAAKP